MRWPGRPRGRWRRRGQTAVETMLLVSVLVVAIVGISWIIAGDETSGGFVNAMKDKADEIDDVYATEPTLPIP